MPPLLSIVIPVLNEAGAIESLLLSLAQARGAEVELIVVDGGSTDGTRALCTGRADRIVASDRGRARQMNAGAAAATGSALLFLHADTTLPAGAPTLVHQALAAGGYEWGRFDVCITGNAPVFRLIAALMNLRSRLSGIATGDQAIFVRRDVFQTLGGFAELPLMEDIEISQRLRRRSAPACLRARVVTSGRRWEKYGIWRTVLLMWRLRLLYWLGVPAERLAALYH